MARPLEPKLDKPAVWKLRFQQRLTYQQIAALHGVSPQAVHQACQSLAQFIPDPEQLQGYEAMRADVLSAVERRLVSSLIDEAKIEKASLNNVAYAFAQIHTARRLESGQSTQNLSVLSNLIESADRKLNPQASTGQASSDPASTDLDASLPLIDNADRSGTYEQS